MNTINNWLKLSKVIGLSIPISTVGNEVPISNRYRIILLIFEKMRWDFNMISKSGTELRILMSESKLRCQNRNSNSDIEIRIENPMSKSKPKFKFGFRHQKFDEIRTKFRRNFDFVESIRSKSKQNSKFRFRHQHQNIQKSKYRNFDEVSISSKVKNDFLWNPRGASNSPDQLTVLITKTRE
jgi:hypothetical protein